MKKPVVIFGIEKMAELAKFYFEHDSNFEVVAFTVDSIYKKSETFLDKPLVEFENIEEKYPPDTYDMFVAIGYKKLNSLRTEKYNEAKKKGYSLITYVSTKSIISDDLKIGDNCFIFENQVIQPFTEIGNNVVMWSGNHLGHDVEIGNNCFVASHAVLSGGVKVGDSSFIGVNATIRDDVKIGKESIIGAGALILNDVEEKSVFIAQPTELYPLDSERFEQMMEISRR